MTDHIASYIDSLESTPFPAAGGPAPDPLEESTGVTDEALDAILDDLDPEQDEEAPVEPEVASDDDGDDEPEEEPEAQEAAAEEPSEDAPDDGEMEKALAALRRDGHGDAVIDALPKEQLLELGRKARERQSKMDDLVRRNAELQKDSGEEPAKDSGTAEPSDAPSVDLDKLVAPLAEELGEEAASSVIPLVRAIVQEATREATEQVASLQGMVPEMRGAILQVVTERARDQLSGEYPKLESPETWEAVQGRMATLAKTGDYTDSVSLMRDACRLEIGSPTEPKRATKRKSAQPTAPKGKKKPPMTADERDEMILNFLDQGMSPSEARAKAAQE